MSSENNVDIKDVFKKYLPSRMCSGLIRINRELDRRISTGYPLWVEQSNTIIAFVESCFNSVKSFSEEAYCNSELKNAFYELMNKIYFMTIIDNNDHFNDKKENGELED